MLAGIKAKMDNFIKEMETEFEHWQKNDLAGGLDQIEKKLKIGVTNISQEILQTMVEKVGEASVDKCSRCGGKTQYKYKRPKIIWTLCGQVTVKRRYYYCCHCGNGESPLDKKLGLDDSHLSGTVRRLISLIGAEVPFERTQELIYEASGIYLSKNTARRVTEQVGNGLNVVQRQLQAKYWLGKEIEDKKALNQVDKLIAETDATSVLTTEGYKQPKLSVVVQKDKTGQRIASRYQGGLMTVEELAQGWTANAHGLGWAQVKKKEVLADGADWIWNIALEYLPEGERIIDYYHPCERIHQVGRSVFGENNLAGKKWVKKLVGKLKSGQVGEIIKRFKGLKHVSKSVQGLVKENITYFNNNGHRMNYPCYRRKGYDIGSGIIEGGCKFIIASRLKRSGMRWDIKNVNNMLALRTALVNKKEWKLFWSDYHVAC
jgi:hypothetical protein